MFGFNSYLLLIVATLVIGIVAQTAIHKAYNKWSQIPIQTGESGFQAARRMLDANGLQHVSINMIQGDDLSDYFDPTKNTLSLSVGVYNGRSVGAVAVACHEAGHAVQHALGYAPARIRMAIVPVVNLASNAWLIVFFMGIFLNAVGLVELAIIMYAAVLVFQVVTLPVEFDASRRGLAFIEGCPYLHPQQVGGAKTVLRAAALTYVAAALASLLQLIYLLGFARSE